jgi:hypothetical protein
LPLALQALQRVQMLQRVRAATRRVRAATRRMRAATKRQSRASFLSDRT